MNFLSHFYFNRQQNRPYFNSGLVLPDQMAVFKRGWKVNEKELPKFKKPVSIEIAEGFREHIATDAIFHESHFFKKNTKFVREVFDSEKIVFPNEKKHFISHIILELLLDRQVILNNEGILEEFYSDLDEINHQILNDFFAEVNQLIPDGFLAFFDRFRNEKYLYKYLENKHLMFILNRILEKVKLPVFSEPIEQSLLDRCIETIEIELKDCISEIKLMIKK